MLCSLTRTTKLEDMESIQPCVTVDSMDAGVKPIGICVWSHERLNRLLALPMKQCRLGRKP